MAHSTSVSDPRAQTFPVDVPPAIELVGVHKRFGTVHAVRGIDLRICSGEIVAFLGPNGAGKTTTIDVILGLSDPTEGTARIYGMKPAEAIRRGLVSAVMQTGGLLKDFTVEEILRYTGSVLSVRVPVAEVMARAGIQELADRMVGKCSGGEQQRIRFAMALLSDPELLLLDEPTQGMDVEGRRDFWKAIRADTEKGRTVMFATHYLEEADLYADRVIVLRKGEIVADGTAAQIKATGSGRTVTATVTGLNERLLGSIPAVEHIEQRGDHLVITSQDSDQVARYLLTQTDAHDLQIATRGLEDAFIALTGDGYRGAKEEGS